MKTMTLFDPMRRRRATMVAAWTMLALLAAPAWAGGDGGGVPVIPGGQSDSSDGGSGGGGGGGGGTPLSVSSEIPYYLELVPGALDATAGELRLTTVDEPHPVPVGGPEEAMLTAEDPTTAVFYEVAGQTLSAQGALTLTSVETVDARLVAPPATQRVALLVLDDGQGTLGSLLDGTTTPDVVVISEPQPEVDVGELATKVWNADWVEELDVSVSVVIASLDAQGGLHLAAARVGAGDPIEIVVD